LWEGCFCLGVSPDASCRNNLCRANLIVCVLCWQNHLYYCDMYTFHRFLYISALICIMRIHIPDLEDFLVCSRAIHRTFFLSWLLTANDRLLILGYPTLAVLTKQIPPWNVAIYNTNAILMLKRWESREMCGGIHQCTIYHHLHF